MKLNTAKNERYILSRPIFRVLMARVKSSVLANQSLINYYFYVLSLNNGTFKVNNDILLILFQYYC